MKYETNNYMQVKLIAENSTESELLQRLFSVLREETISTGVIRLQEQKGLNVLVVEI